MIFLLAILEQEGIRFTEPSLELFWIFGFEFSFTQLISLITLELFFENFSRLVVVWFSFDMKFLGDWGIFNKYFYDLFLSSAFTPYLSLISSSVKNLFGGFIN